MNEQRPSEIEAQLRTVLQHLTGQDTGALAADDDLIEVLGLDSLTGLRFLAAVEKQFDVRFPDDQLGELRTLRRIARHLANPADRRTP